MDEFTSIAIWLFVVYMALNATIIWFATSETFVDNGLGIPGITPDTSYSESDLESTKTDFFGTDCSTVAPTDLAFAPCFLQQTVSMFSKLMNSFWVFLTAWAGLLTVILAPVPGGDLFLGILIPFFGIVECVALIVVLMRVSAIVRGVAGGFL